MPEDRMPYDEWTMADIVTMWGKTHHVIMSALQDSIGHERLERELRGPMQQAGREAARPRPADAVAIGRAIMAIERPWGIEGRVIKATPNHFVREVTRCPWSYFCPLGCEVFAWWMEGFVEGSNEHLRYALEKLVPRGDPTCRWSVEKQSPRN